MPQPQTLIDVLWNGAVQVRKGTEYTDFLKTDNNIIKFSIDTKVSINRSPFVKHYTNELILIDKTFTYSFEIDTTMSEGKTPTHP